MFNSFFPRPDNRWRRLLWPLALTWTLSVVACSASGPPFRDAPTGELSPIESGYYRFDPAPQFFDDPLLGEVYFSRTRSRENPQSLFHMRMLGRDRKNAIRVRQYEGEVWRFGGRIELRARRCYLFGKREWDDKLTPLSRWECDHLIFTYESPSEFTRPDVLRPIADSPRGEFTEWFQATPLHPMPSPAGAESLSDRRIFFAGQIFPLPAGELLPAEAQVVVWGYQGGRLLRDGQTLTVQDAQGQVQGRLKVVSRPGDFLLCQWLSKERPTSGVAFTRESLLNQGGGLFD
jgi:hypothetical protein